MTLQRILDNVNPDSLSDIEKRLAFFQIAVELERIKEPDISETYPYPIDYKNDKLIVVELPSNPQFLQIFENNRAPQITRWPQDLYVGLNVLIGNRELNLLYNQIAFDEIKNIDVTKKPLTIPIENFEINWRESEKVHLLPEQIETINNAIKEVKTLSDIQKVIQEQIDSDVINLLAELIY